MLTVNSYYRPIINGSVSLKFLNHLHMLSVIFSCGVVIKINLGKASNDVVSYFKISTVLMLDLRN
jgi:hypothetical protein